jgi:hypothetical protein
MLALFASGILVPVDHNLLYSRLDGSVVLRPDEGSQYLTQIWIICYGKAFALKKLCLRVQLL